MPLRAFFGSTALRSIPLTLSLTWLLGSANLYAQTAPAPIEVRSPQGQLVLPKAPWRQPAPAVLKFTVQGKVKSIPFKTTAQLDWRAQGKRYEAAQEVQIPIVGSRRQSSIGTINANGLEPEIFLDRSRKEYSTTFDTQARDIRFSRNNETAPLVPGTQDRLSAFFQVAGMIAAAPKLYPAGTQITVMAASSRRVSPWIFTVRGTENLQLPAGSMAAIKLEHNSENNDAEGLQSALWLAPSLQYLPVRIRMLEDGGRDELDLKLQSHSKP